MRLYTNTFYSHGEDSHFEDDLYQVRIKLTRGSLSATKDTYEWKLLRIPFSSFYLTARGQVREQQRGNDSLQVTSVGFLFSNPKSRVEGPISENAGEEIVDFELDLRSIRALADIRGAK